MADTIKFASEHQLQAACVEWFWNTYHEHRGMFYANNNNSVNSIAGNKARSLGVVAGVADTTLILDHGRVYYIEFKLPGGRQSPAQVEFESKVTKRGHWYTIIDTLESFKQMIWNLLGTR